MSARGPGGALRRVELEAANAGERPVSGRGPAPAGSSASDYIGKSRKGARTPSRTANWVDQLIDREVKAGRLKVTPSQRRRLAETMKGLGPDRLQRLVAGDETTPLVQQLETLASAEGVKPNKRSSGDPIMRALNAIGSASLKLQGGPGGNAIEGALQNVENRARAAGVTPRGENPSPNLGGPPGNRLLPTVNDMTATRDQGEHLTVIHPTPGNNRGQVVRESQHDIADEAEQKLLAGQGLSQQEISALQATGRLGLNQNSSPTAVNQGLFSGTGIITGYEPILNPASTQEGSEGGERIRKPGVQGKPNEAGTNTTGKRPIVKTAGQLEDELSDKSPEEIKALQKKLKDANLLPQGAAISGYVDPDTIKAYDELLKETANYQTHFRDLTPDQYLDKKIAGINAAGGAGKTTTSTNTQTSINLTDPITAKGYITGSMRSLLGRMPTASEVNGFVTALNTAERDNPNVTTSTSTTTQNGAGTNTNTNTSSTSSGGISSGADFGDDFIMQNNMPELRASNAVQFYQLALQALRSPVSV